MIKPVARKNFGFLLFHDFEDLDFFGPWEIIGLWGKDFSGPQNRWVIHENSHQVKSSKGLVINTTHTFSNCPKLDYLLIPGGMGTRTEVNNAALISFIAMKALECETILSVCTGAFLLQKAGLLHNKNVTTHFASLNRLMAFDDVTVKQQRYVQDGNLWTSAGVSAGIDMSLAFVAEQAGEDIAGALQLYAEYYPECKMYPAGKAVPDYVNLSNFENMSR